MWNFPVMPEQASEFAPEYDKLFWMTTALTVFFTLLVGIGIIVIAIRYRQGSKVNRKNPVNTHLALEITWSVIPLVMGLGIFFWAAKLFVDSRQPPKDAMDIFVIGKQWMWHVQHPGGIRENNTLHVPVGKAVRLTMISQDVIHSFFVPQFRIKQDVLPGRYTMQWFRATKIGKYNLFCTEYCGTQHSEMGGYVHVMSQADYQEWLNSGGEDPGERKPTMEESGKKIWDRLACGNCHGAQDAERGPSLFGIIGTERKMKDGSMARVDASYLRESVVDPYRKLTEGYEKTMPAYKGQITEEEILQLIAYLRTLGAAPAPASPPSPADAATTPAESGAGN